MANDLRSRHKGMQFVPAMLRLDAAACKHVRRCKLKETESRVSCIIAATPFLQVYTTQQLADRVHRITALPRLCSISSEEKLMAKDLRPRDRGMKTQYVPARLKLDTACKHDQR